MMLVVREDKHNEHEAVEMDEYVPFTAEFGEKESLPLYWRGGNGKFSLVEFGVTKAGKVCSISLTSINQESVTETDEPLPGSVFETKGLPIFDIANWPSNVSDYADHFQDEFDSEIKLIIGRSYLSLVFVKVGDPVRYIRNERIRFWVASNGELATVDLVELTQEQIAVIKSAIYI